MSIVHRTSAIVILLLAGWLAGSASAQQHTAGSENQATIATDAAHSAKEGAAHDGAHGEGEVSPLPDVTARDTYTSALWVFIIFLAMLAILYPTAWKNVLAGLKAREQRIRKDIADAEEARKRAEATLAEYNTQLAAAEARVREMIAGAVTQGERVAADIRARATAEAEESRQRALREIDSARKQALAEIYERAAELSTGIAEKILRRNINVDDQRELVRRSLEELQTVQR